NKGRNYGIKKSKIQARRVRSAGVGSSKGVNFSAASFGRVGRFFEVLRCNTHALAKFFENLGLGPQSSEVLAKGADFCATNFGLVVIDKTNFIAFAQTIAAPGVDNHIIRTNVNDFGRRGSALHKNGRGEPKESNQGISRPTHGGPAAR